MVSIGLFFRVDDFKKIFKIQAINQLVSDTNLSEEIGFKTDHATPGKHIHGEWIYRNGVVHNKVL